jgi:hypothetical protein
MISGNLVALSQGDLRRFAMHLRMMAAICGLALGSVSAMGQAGSAQAPETATLVTPAATVDSELTLIEHEMMGAVKAMPAEKFGFAPSAAIFAPAQANYFFFMTISGLKPDVDVRGLAKLTQKDDVVNALAASFAFGHKAIATLTAANAFEVVKIPEPGLQTRSTLATFAVAHAFDHYGQMVEYLRMNGIVPPASAK